MLHSGDIVLVDLGIPEGAATGLVRPAVVVTADRVLRREPTVVQVVPLSRVERGFESEVAIEVHDDRSIAPAAVQCQHVRSVAATRVGDHVGTVGDAATAGVREALAVLLDC